VYDIIGFTAWMVSFLEVVTWRVNFSIRMGVNIFVIVFGGFVLIGSYWKAKSGGSL
jgi:hypothetical protein